MQVMYINQVLGLDLVLYYLFQHDKPKHLQFMQELADNQATDILDDVFPDATDKERMADFAGFSIIDGSLHSFSTISTNNKAIRVNPVIHEIFKRYTENIPKISLSFKEILDEDFDRMIVATWDDGSESILFSS